MASDQLPVGGHQHRHGPAELGHAGGDLHDLTGVVGLGVSGVGFQPGEWPMFNPARQQGRVHAAILFAFRSAKLSPVSTSTASWPVNDCQRSTATST